MTPSGIAGTFSEEGNPERSRFVSSAGPFSVMSFGVWQSWHPPSVTRYLPRVKAADLGVDAGSFATGGSAASELATKQHANTGTPIIFRSDVHSRTSSRCRSAYKIMLSVEGECLSIKTQGESIDQRRAGQGSRPASLRRLPDSGKLRQRSGIPATSGRV